MPISFKALFLHHAGIQCCENVWPSLLFWIICCATKWFSNETLLTCRICNEHLKQRVIQRYVGICGLPHLGATYTYILYVQAIVLIMQPQHCLLTKTRQVCAVPNVDYRNWPE